MGRNNSSERLARLLALPAWVAEEGIVSIAQAAAHFEVSEEQIRKDVSLLWMTGLPGQEPGDLVDFDAVDLEDGYLSLTQTLGLDVPVRLSQDEATSLLLALQVLRESLESVPAADNLLRSATEKLVQAMGASADFLSVDTEMAGEKLGASAETSDAQILYTLQEAVELQRRVHLRYVSATDEVTERDVDIIELISDGTHISVNGWCYLAKAERTFRVDRIAEVQILSVDITRNAARRRRTAHRVDTWTEEAALQVSSGGRWISEQIPCDSVIEKPDHDLEIALRGRDRQWLKQLVLSAGAHMRVVEPEWLAHEASQSARAALKLYEEPPTGA